MTENTMKVKCPNNSCGALLTIQDTPGIADKMLRCPVCQHRDKVSVFIAEINKLEDRTELCLQDSYKSTGTLIVNGVSYPLAEGPNTIGRKSVTSVADVQLAVDDKRMSRMHICITVVKKNDFYQHQIENISSRNKVIINGKYLQAGEVEILKYDDIIRLGETEIKFEK